MKRWYLLEVWGETSFFDKCMKLELFFQVSLILTSSTFLNWHLLDCQISKSGKVDLALYFMLCRIYSPKSNLFIIFSYIYTMFRLGSWCKLLCFPQNHTDIYLTLALAFQIYMIIYANNSQSYKTSYTNLKAGYIKHKYYF